MSEIPKRVWLVGPCDESPGWDEGIHQDGSRGELFISAAALRELVERWLTESTDPDWPKQAREAWVDCANELEKLLEDE
jgi:hypothetical protein